MNLYLGTILHIVSSITLPLVPMQLVYVEAGAPAHCAFQALSWDGSAWHAQVSACVSDRIFRSIFETN